MHNCNHINITVGSIVMINRFPGTKWLVCNGWYTYEGRSQNGMYLSSIPARTILPLTNEELIQMTIVSSSCHPTPPPPPHTFPGCNPYPPPPVPYPPCGPSMQQPVEDYLPGVNYVEGQLVWLTPGELYQVTKNFTSSSDKVSPIENLQQDALLGNLIIVGGNDDSGESDDISRIPEESIESIF